jgi:hypothetical protein
MKIHNFCIFHILDDGKIYNYQDLTFEVFGLLELKGQIKKL